MNLRRYLMVKQALMDQATFNHVNSQAGAGKPQRTWGEFAMSTNPLGWATGNKISLLGGAGNLAADNRAKAQQADAYTSYLKSEGVGQGALSKEDFLKTHATPQLKRTWNEFLGNGPLGWMTNTRNSWLGGSGNESWKQRQALSDTNAYNEYLKNFSAGQQQPAAQ